MQDKNNTSTPQEPIQIGFLHPGEMGSAMAKVIQRNGAIALWASEGRSSGTAARAAAAGMRDVGTLEDLCRQCDVIISICPPHAAIDVAKATAACGFDGAYVDANAISPSTAIQIADIVAQSGATYTDASVVGPAPDGKRQTFIYFSGDAAESIANYFNAEALTVELLGPSRSLASALKICHSAMQKGALALLFTTLAAAEHYGVRAPLESLWAIRPETNPLINDIEQSPRIAAKSWRFAGEMLEVADAFAAVGLPSALFQGARDVYQRCAAPTPGQSLGSIEALISTLLNHGNHRE